MYCDPIMRQHKPSEEGTGLTEALKEANQSGNDRELAVSVLISLLKESLLWTRLMLRPRERKWNQIYEMKIKKLLKSSVWD
jgi:hypothetical protein